MKINRLTEDRSVKPFDELCVGDCFELDGRLYVKTTNNTGEAVLLAGADTRMANPFPNDQCILVDVEISYIYRRPEKDERND